jgi:hypothetical protein
VEINVIGPCDIPKEEEILECAISWKNHGYTLRIRKMFFLWTSCLWGQLWNHNQYVSTSNEPECLTLSYSSNRKNVCSVAPPWDC